LEGSDCSLIETETRNLLSAFKENPWKASFGKRGLSTEIWTKNLWNISPY
jgi:hypothetical protein